MNISISFHKLCFVADKKPQMSYNEEAYLLQSVNKSDLKSLTPSVRRLYRKLAVRKLKREYSLPLFDIDRFTTNPEANRKLQKQNNRILDRFYRQNLSGFFEQRLQGYHEPASIHSPYTNRLLKPFIRRDTSCRPLWLRVMDELCAKVNKNNPTWKPDEPGSIDYCYVRPHHIPAINSLARQFFWPGIDRKLNNYFMTIVFCDVFILRFIFSLQLANVCNIPILVALFYTRNCSWVLQFSFLMLAATRLTFHSS